MKPGADFSLTVKVLDGISSQQQAVLSALQMFRATALTDGLGSVLGTAPAAPTVRPSSGDSVSLKPHQPTSALFRLLFHSFLTSAFTELKSQGLSLGEASAERNVVAA